jgi:TonB-dependent receptor
MEGSFMSSINRKSAISMAVSLALLGASARPGFAAQDTPQPGNASGDKLEEIIVTGVRQSQIRAIQLKRDAASIQDSISAESIGQLPDTTITDALQRITGVQINRDAGVGTSVSVRGLPQVGTMLNGEVFISPDQIDSQQPDFTTLPATLFNQVDVIKSPTAAHTVTGISGALDLHTYRPWDLPSGFTYSYTADAERGSVARKTGPEFAGLFSYNADGRWGLQISADYSDTTRTKSNEGLDQYGAVLNGENAASAAGYSGSYSGFLNSWGNAPIPPQIVQNPDGSVDVNGDGKSNGVFLGSQNFALADITTQRKRLSANASFQMDFGSGFKLTSDYFYAHQVQHERNVGIQIDSANWQGATFVPVRSRNTGATVIGGYNTPGDAYAAFWEGSQVYTTQVYEKWPGDVESYSGGIRTTSTAQNFNVQLDYDNGGKFTGGMRAVRETARQEYIETDTNISNADGCQWGDDRTGLPCGTFVYPAELGGDRVFNPNGIPQNTVPMTVDFRGRNMLVSMPASLASAFADSNSWAFKTLESADDYERQTAITALRFDGHYKFNDRFKLDFGVRDSLRTADNNGFTLVAPVYAGMGASDPNGCLVRYVAADVVLGGNAHDGIPSTWCTAGNAEGFFRAGPFSAQPVSQTPGPLANAWRPYTNLLGSGINFWGIDPRALDDPEALWKALLPGARRQTAPGVTWAVNVKERSGYLQGNFKGEWGDMSYSGNVGARFIHTTLNVTQDNVGDAGQYGTEAAVTGQEVTRRSYTDVLPAVNFALNLTPKMTLRAAISKNMQPLDLSQWGGGLTLNYSSYQTPQGLQFQVSQGNSSGNPNLNPWRSTNYGLSLEYYLNPTSLVSLELFRINVQSFIINGFTQACGLPDEDGVVRNASRCIEISAPKQGSGNYLQGAEFDYRQGFTFLPGLLANTGMEFNVTYAPSHTGDTDLAGNKIPFQDNSTESGNLILWYQDKKFQARVAYNYRSKRAAENGVGGIAGLEMYEAPQKYVDASVAYKLSKYAEVFVDGTNLTNEYQRYYLVWPDQASHSDFSERMFVAGVRGQW